MRLLGIESLRVPLTLRQPVGTSAGTHLERPVLYVRVVTDELEGWGECGALAAGTAVDPALGDVEAALAEVGVPRLFSASAARRGELPEAAGIGALFNIDPVAQMVAATLEMAVLDVELRAAGRSLVDRLGGRPGPVPSGVVAGIPADRRLATLLEVVGAHVAAGASRVRLKIEPGWDLWPVRTVREHYPDLTLQVDANGAYRLGSGGDDDAEHLVALEAYQLGCLEQPLAPADLPGHAALAARLSIPVCLDESLSSLQRVTDALRSKACQVACLKPARLGGLFAARRAERLCADAGVGAFVGGFFETGLGRAANAALAAGPGFNLAGDLGDPAAYLDHDPCGYLQTGADWVLPSRLPGVGRAPTSGSVSSAGVSRRWHAFAH